MKLSRAHADDKQWVSYVLNNLDRTLAARPSSDVTISIVLAMIGLTCLVSCSMILRSDRLDFRKGATKPDAKSKDKLRFYSRDRRLAPSPTGTLTDATLEQSAQAGSSARHVPEESSPPTNANKPSLRSQLPPLCPTLLMPNCNARFGIPMSQIDDLTRNWYGELTIVGISNIPLLRAVVKKVGSSRTLDIFSVTGHNGVPRASLTTSTSAAKSRKGLEIHGMQGFYGFLEMPSHGTCSVIKDGQTVLYIDRQADDLSLVLKSGLGAKLADMRSSSEQFGGSEHFEVCVEAGIDMVLILAVVLADLVFSPYHK
jgi:hypothetical protein